MTVRTLTGGGDAERLLDVGAHRARGRLGERAGTAGSAAPSIERTGCTSSSVEAMNASRAAQVVERDRPSGASTVEQPAARDRVEDVVRQRRRHQRLAVERAEEGARRALQHAAVGVTSSASSAPARRQAAASMLPA